MISKTSLSEALSAFCWEKEQFSLKGRRHKERLSNLPEALREACGGAENSSLLSTTAREPEENPLPPRWRGTQHTSPWQSCKQPAAQQAKTVGKTLLKVREGLLSGGLINQYGALIAGGCSRLKEANDFSIWSAGFVPYGSTVARGACPSATTPSTLPPAEGMGNQGNGKLPAFLRDICLW